MNQDNYLDIDYIIKNHKRLYYFGLGFVQAVFTDTERVHFYNKDIVRMNDEVHNHRYNFQSKIIKGHFLQTKWRLAKGDTHILTNESCSKERELTNVVSIPVSIYKKYTDEFCINQVYDCMYNEFHSVDYVGNTITRLRRSPIILDYAQVIYPKGKDITCPFSKTYSNDELYQIIEDTIKN